MASPSITIRIDFGSESGDDAGSSIAMTGAVAAPQSAALSQSVSVVPTPFDSAARSVGQTDPGEPAPSPSFAPSANPGSSSGSSELLTVPTPFSASAFLLQAAGQSVDVIPTPMDSVYSHAISDHAPTPMHTPPAPASHSEDSSKRGTK